MIQQEALENCIFCISFKLMTNAELQESFESLKSQSSKDALKLIGAEVVSKSSLTRVLHLQAMKIELM